VFDVMFPVVLEVPREVGGSSLRNTSPAGNGQRIPQHSPRLRILTLNGGVGEGDVAAILALKPPVGVARNVLSFASTYSTHDCPPSNPSTASRKRRHSA
jgi:hypothetical protein